MVLAHEVIVVRDRECAHEALPAGTKPPVLIDEGCIIQGSKAILVYLEKLETFKEWWDKFQSDACYCDEEADPGIEF